MNSGKSNGLGVGTVLAIVFTILKLTGTITWPWIWVLCPAWIPWAILLLVLVIVSLLDMMVALAEDKEKPKGLAVV